MMAKPYDSEDDTDDDKDHKNDSNTAAGAAPGASVPVSSSMVTNFLWHNSGPQIKFSRKNYGISTETETTKN